MELGKNTPDVFSYIEWRGDLRMAADPINDVDISILCRLAYIPFDDVVSSRVGDASVSLREAAQAVLDLAEQSQKVFHKKEDQRLLEAMLDSPRFSGIRLSYFVDIFNETLEEQFCAISMELDDGTLAVVFRGTDGTLVGWKEDFNMCFSSEIPAQKDAVDYLTSAAAQIPGKQLRVVGHSKGGNLAMYASTFCDEAIQRRIIAVRNLDGPGFNEDRASEEKFSRIADVTLTILPDSSIIGMLLVRMGKSIVIDSQSMGLFQHNTYHWEIRRTGFIEREELNDSSYRIDRTLKDWLGSLTPEQRERMFDAFFQVLQSSDAKTLRELWNGRNGLAILSTLVKLDPETRANITIGTKLLARAMKNNILTDRMMDQELN